MKILNLLALIALLAVLGSAVAQSGTIDLLKLQHERFDCLDLEFAEFVYVCTYNIFQGATRCADPQRGYWGAARCTSSRICFILWEYP
jgi:hypothetical protein